MGDNEKCSLHAKRLGCKHRFAFKGTSDAICQCKACDPASWSGNEKTCGKCAALVKVNKFGGNCEDYCKAQHPDLRCDDAWDDTTDGQCSLGARRMGCLHKFKGTSDAVCECGWLVPWLRRLLRGAH